ncbi:MAG: hypothetical protein B7733_06860 [Myxococcales bacterium FL481]|nr:MAG: hypothetical protein B7733_06860 [Myxococcales bacterium FL481]
MSGYRSLFVMALGCGCHLGPIPDHDHSEMEQAIVESGEPTSSETDLPDPGPADEDCEPAAPADPCAAHLDEASCQSDPACESVRALVYLTRNEDGESCVASDPTFKGCRTHLGGCAQVIMTLCNECGDIVQIGDSCGLPGYGGCPDDLPQYPFC